ncbi:hypothetical protein DSO57_1004755 [Entomophthora muscae]|uniref:Uncharacterized protein n=1 Tax=Entomophthora muscae TaxID=34485 RepID=A0ACC2UHN5_9FUNG|nr:hypothetical protein DSO57_1004755 [Entomophthora muscae]
MVESVAEILVGAHLKQDPELIHIMGSYFQNIEKTMRQGLRWMLIPVFGSQIAHMIIRRNTPSIATRKRILDKIAPSLAHRSTLTHRPLAISVAEMMLDDGNAPDTIADTLMILVFLSNYTVSGLCRRVLGDLLAHPHFFDAIRQEQRDVIAATGSKPVTWDQIDMMPRLDSTLRESMRHRASRPEHFRMASQDILLPNGRTIPQGSLMAVDMASIHFPTKDLIDYQPFRFVNTNIHSSQLTRDFLLFGAGKHACPGRVYATQIIKAFIATLLRSYKVHLKHGSIEFNTYEDVFPDAHLILTPA